MWVWAEERAPVLSTLMWSVVEKIPTERVQPPFVARGSGGFKFTYDMPLAIFHKTWILLSLQVTTSQK